MVAKTESKIPPPPSTSTLQPAPEKRREAGRRAGMYIKPALQPARPPLVRCAKHADTAVSFHRVRFTGTRYSQRRGAALTLGGVNAGVGAVQHSINPIKAKTAVQFFRGGETTGNKLRGLSPERGVVLSYHPITGDHS